MAMVMVMMSQHFSNHRVKNNLHLSLLISHDYCDRWVEECYLHGKNMLKAVAQNTKEHMFIYILIY